MEFKEEYRDLFTMDESYAFAHCISRDCAMGAGIAKQFVRRYPNLRNQVLIRHPKIGRVIPVTENNKLSIICLQKRIIGTNLQGMTLTEH